MRVELRRIWKAATIKPSRLPAIDSVCKRILENKERYEEVEKNTGVPWPVVAAWHYRESNLNFNTHLHCGDPLTGRTYHVPKGRPAAEPMNGKGKPYTWLESAYDALVKLKGLNRIKRWTVEQLCYTSIAFNGWGYWFRGVPSPYLLAGTDQYAKGKFVADHLYAPNHVDTQLGVVAIIKRLDEMDGSFDLTNADEPVWKTVKGSKSLIALLGGGLFYAGTVITDFIQHGWDGLVSLLSAAPQLVGTTRETVAMGQEVTGWLDVDWSSVGKYVVLITMGIAFCRHLTLKKDLEKTGDEDLAPVVDDDVSVDETVVGSELTDGTTYYVKDVLSENSFVIPKKTRRKPVVSKKAKPKVKVVAKKKKKAKAK
jgi:lysozyme family protein